ncbi:Homeodomain-like protein [Artemisia annua]|uniref:Homeodomain-like protein n=1 Tax=Artemisia annua TaxID=35608 RepID=A0A2U1LHD1_ARTAN|nr:Homeodomain-like protein [Artemisia annua]
MDWTNPENKKLCEVVKYHGDTNSQHVASILLGRLVPNALVGRTRTRKWEPDEDKHLKIAANLFGGKSWNKVATLVPGRTQMQCREKWCNMLDPSLNMGKWTEEEELKLIDAVAEHDY